MNKKWNIKLMIILLCCVIALIHIIYIWQDNKIEEEYYCSTNEIIPEIQDTYPVSSIVQTFITKKTSLNSLEFMFGNVPVDITTMTVKISNSTKVIYQSTIPLQNLINDTWYKLYVNIPTNKQEQYQIELTAENCAVSPFIYTITNDNAAPESESCIINGVEQQGQLLLRYGYLKEPHNLDKLLKTIMSLIIFMLILCVIIKGDLVSGRIKKLQLVMLQRLEESKYIYVFIQLILCYILIETSGIEFQTPMKVVLYSISFLAGYKINSVIKFFNTNLTRRSSYLQFAIVVLFSAFAFVGNRMFIYPLNMKVTGVQILIFILASIWLLSPVALFLSWYNNMRLLQKKQINTRGFIIITALLLILPACYALYAFNPGISTWDSDSCLAVSAHDIYNMTNWHPPFYSLILKAIIMVWDSTYAVILVQFFFWIYVAIEGMLFLRKRGIDQKFLLVVAFLLGINPANYLHLCTIWKDIPYAISVMWLTIIVAKFVLDHDVKKKWYIYLEFVVALVFTFFIRQNGMVVYALSVVFLAVVIKKNIKLLASIFVSILLILAIKYPLYSYIGVQESAIGGIYIGLSQDILGVYYAGGELSEESMEMVNVLTYYNNGQFIYNPYFATSSYDLDVEMTTFIKNYMDTFIKNPVIMIREIILRQDCSWDLFGGKNATLGCVNLTDTMDHYGIWNDYYPFRVTNEFTHRMLKFQNYVAENQLLNTMTWKSGIYTLFVVFAFLSTLIKKNDKRVWLVFIPFIGQIVSLMLSTGWSEFRYYWPLNLMAVFIVLLIPTLHQDDKATSSSRNASSVKKTNKIKE